MVCMNLQTVEMSHENQQNELYCNPKYLIPVSNKHNCHNIFTLTSLSCWVVNVTGEAAIYRMMSSQTA